MNLRESDPAQFYSDPRCGARPTMAVFIMEFRDGKVVRETDYFGERFDPREYRSTWWS